MKEPSFLGIPKRDWWPVGLFALSCGLLYFLIYRFIPTPFDVLLIAWFIVGQAMLVKYNAIARPYPRTLSGSLVSFFMAAIWPKYIK